jgi:uncharacterized repeat protein (TIGR01451 family)
MKPNVLNGDTVEVAPISAGQPQRGDIVLARGLAGFRLHRIVGWNKTTGRIVTRGDAGQQNDEPPEVVLGKVVAIERNGKKILFGAPGTNLLHAVRTQTRRLLLAAARRTPPVRSVLVPFVFLLLAIFLFASSAAAQFTVSDTAAPASSGQGATITYTQVLTYTGLLFTPSAGNPVRTTQTFPATVTYQSFAVSGTASGNWGCLLAGSTLTCTDSSGTTSYLNGNTTTFTITVTVNASAPNGTVNNTVNSSPGGGTASASVTLQTPDLGVTETATPNPVATGGNITYTETVTNNSATSAAGGATLTQNTPPGTRFVSVTPPTGWTCGTKPAVGGTGAITCTATGNFNGGASSIFSVVVSVNPETTAGSTITNSVTVSETGTDPNPANNTATASVVVSGADLSMTQVASVSAVAPGSTITYTETVTNNGPNAAVGAVLYQQTPPNTTFSSMTPPTGWTCGTAPAVGGTGQVICTDGSNLNSSTTTTTFTFVVTVNDHELGRCNFANKRSSSYEQRNHDVSIGGDDGRFRSGCFHDRFADSRIRIVGDLVHDSGDEFGPGIRYGCNTYGYAARYADECVGNDFGGELRRAIRWGHYVQSRDGRLSVSYSDNDHGFRHDSGNRHNDDQRGSRFDHRHGPRTRQ